VYEESRCYPLCYFCTCFLFMFSFAFYSSIYLLVFMLTLIFIYCILTFFFFVYHFSCYIFVLFFFTCLSFFDCCANFFFLGQIFFSMAFVEVLVSSKLFLFVEFCWCKTCHHFVALYFLFIIVAMCRLLSYLFLFLFLFFPLLCKFLLLLTHVLSFFLSLHQKIMMINLTLLHLFWCLVDYFFALYFVDAWILCNTPYLYCILSKCTYLVSLPLKEVFEWKKTSFENIIGDTFIKESF